MVSITCLPSVVSFVTFSHFVIGHLKCQAVSLGFYVRNACEVDGKGLSDANQKCVAFIWILPHKQSPCIWSFSCNNSHKLFGFYLYGFINLNTICALNQKDDPSDPLIMTAPSCPLLTLYIQNQNIEIHSSTCSYSLVCNLMQTFANYALLCLTVWCADRLVCVSEVPLAPMVSLSIPSSQTLSPPCFPPALLHLFFCAWLTQAPPLCHSWYNTLTLGSSLKPFWQHLIINVRWHFDAGSQHWLQRFRHYVSAKLRLDKRLQ